MRIWRAQRPLILVLIGLLLLGLCLVFTAGQTFLGIQFNLGIELLGSAVSVLLIDVIVTHYIERREASRRRPILEIIDRRLQKLVGELVDHLRLIDLDITEDLSSAERLGHRLHPALLNERIETAPGHRVPKILHFEAAASWTMKFLGDLYDITRIDLPPEVASAILAVISVNSESWSSLIPPASGVDAEWVAEHCGLLFDYYDAVKGLRERLDRLHRELHGAGEGRR